MANCINCSAPLPTDSMVCRYCGTRNDVDLKVIHRHTVEEPESDRGCPRCNIPLQTIDLKVEGRFLIEKCRQCYGLFFDPGELEAILDKSVANVFVIDHKKIDNLRSQRRHDDYPVRYIKCPVCGKLMNRINFASRSGVIVDRCKNHGVWLDGGELRHLMEWVKAGGQLLHHKSHMEQERLAIQREKKRLRAQAQKAGSGSWIYDTDGRDDFAGWGRDFGSSRRDEPELLRLLSRFVAKLF